MAKISYTFESKYTLDSYDDVIRIYNWLRGCLEYVFLDLDNVEISVSINFSSKKIEYDCSSLVDFKEHAFGHEIQPISLFVGARSGYKLLAHFYTRRNPEQKCQEIILSSESKADLISLKDTLILDEVSVTQKLNFNSPKQSVIVTNCNINSDVQIVNQTHVGNANVNQANDNQTNVITKNDAKTIKEPWYSKLFWQIFIPIAVGVAITAIALWLKLK